MATEADADFVRAALGRYREPLLRFAASLLVTIKLRYKLPEGDTM